MTCPVIADGQGDAPPPKESKVPRPVFLSAQRISGVVDREVVAEENAELRKVGTVLTADRLTYWPVDDEVEAIGNVRAFEQVKTSFPVRMRV
jgi:LPS-assembly protein